MNRFLAMMLAAILLVTCLSAFAEGNGTCYEEAGLSTAFFANSAGGIMTRSIKCAAADKQPAGEVVDAAPEAGTSAETDAAGATANEVGAYRVIVLGTDGNPVKGAVVQLCDDTTCSLQKTGADGVATFQVKTQKVYEVHVAKVPEGYVSSDEAYKTLDTFSDVSITVSKAE